MLGRIRIDPHVHDPQFAGGVHVQRTVGQEHLRQRQRPSGRVVDGDVAGLITVQFDVVHRRPVHAASARLRDDDVVRGELERADAAAGRQRDLIGDQIDRRIGRSDFQDRATRSERHVNLPSVCRSLQEAHRLPRDVGQGVFRGDRVVAGVDQAECQIAARRQADRVIARVRPHSNILDQHVAACVHGKIAVQHIRLVDCEQAVIGMVDRHIARLVADEPQFVGIEREAVAHLAVQG